MRDIRQSPHDETVWCAFFTVDASGNWLSYGRYQTITRRMPFVASEPAIFDDQLLAGVIYWDNVKVFESPPVKTKAGDSFTFWLENHDK